jgi:hypothetical protein
MAFLAVVDACALYPFHLRDTLLRLADREFYDVRWSGEILNEMSRNLIENHGMSPEGAQHLVDQMQAYFPEAMVPAEAIGHLIPVMTNDEKDRHVLAAAQACGAEAVITSNLKHFPETSTAPLGIDAIHPDDFLQTLFAIDPALVNLVLEEQAADLIDPPFTVDEVLEALHRDAPEFVSLVQQFRSATGPS